MKTIAAFAMLALALPAMAHPGHAETSGLLAGLAHPFTGVDHLLAMLGVGIWSRQQGRAALMVPAFLALMVAGALWQTTMPIELGLAASVALIGALLAAAVRLPAGGALALAAVFAVLHGQAHGRELAGMGAMAGFMLSAAVLLAAGWCAAGPRLGRIAGGLIGAAGLCLLAGVA